MSPHRASFHKSSNNNNNNITDAVDMQLDHKCCEVLLLTWTCPCAGWPGLQLLQRLRLLPARHRRRHSGAAGWWGTA